MLLPPWRTALACAAVTGTLVATAVAAAPGPAPVAAVHRPLATSSAAMGPAAQQGVSARVAAATDHLLDRLVAGRSPHTLRASAVQPGKHLRRVRQPLPSRPPAAAAAAAAADPAPEPLTFTVASFNVLGSQHTAARGTKPWYAAGTSRAAWAEELMRERGYDVVGLQESQPDQVRVLRATGTWSSYPDPRTARQPGLAQSVIWRADTWEMVSATSFPIPFLGRPRPQPAVLLEHRVTGRRIWFVNVHLTPRRDRRDGERERDLGTAALVAQVREVASEDVPVVVTGDMNEHADVYCRLTAATRLVAASGGSHAARCLPPRVMRVDWIFGTPDLQWSAFRFAADPAVRRITDHAVPVAEVTVR